MARREPCIQSIKKRKYLIWENISFEKIFDFFQTLERERERERERRKSKSSFGDFSGFCLSEFVRSITKVYHLDEGYPYTPKMRDLIKDSKNEIWGKSKFSSYEMFSSFLTVFPTLQKVGILHILILFLPLG